MSALSMLDRAIEALQTGACPRLPPLHRAVRDGDTHKITQRLALGDNVNRIAEGHGIPGTACVPLYIAVKSQEREIVRILMEAGADAGLEVPPLPSPLVAAIFYGDLPTTQLLLQFGARVDRVDSKGVLPLSYSPDVRITEALLSAGAPIDVADSTGNTPIIDAAERGSEGCVRALIAAGADLSRSDKEGFTALHRGAKGDGGAFNMMKKSMVRIQAGDFSLPEQFPEAAQAKIVSRLLQAGASPDSRNHRFETPLMVARDLPVLKLLLDASASALATDINGNNVLHHAGADCWSSAMICTVFKAGADPTLRNKCGDTPADLARSNGHHTTAQLLEMLATKYREKVPLLTTAETPRKGSGTADLEAKMEDLAVSSSASGEEAKAIVTNDLGPAEMPCKGGSATVELEDNMKTVALSSNVGSEEVKPIVTNDQRRLAPSLYKGGSADVELEDKMKTVILGSDVCSEEAKATSAVSQSIEGSKDGQQDRVVKPCLHCQTLTHRRCARCRKVYLCSRDCQMATMAEHKPMCMQMYEERQAAKAGREKTDGKTEEEGF